MINRGARLVALQRAIFLSLAVSAVVLVVWSTRYTQLSDGRVMAMAIVARNLAEGRGFVTESFSPLSLHFVPRIQNHPELSQLPVYPFLLALWMRWWGVSEVVVTSLAVLFFCVSLVGLYRLAVRCFDPAIATTTVLLTALHPAVLDSVLQGHDTAFLMALLLILFFCFARDLEELGGEGEEEGKRSAIPVRRCLVTAVLVALAALTRFEMLALAPVVWAYWLWHAYRRSGVSATPSWDSGRVRRARAWRLSAQFWLVFLVLLLPWLIRSSWITRRPFFTLQGYELVMATWPWPGQSLYWTYATPPDWPPLAALQNLRWMLGKLNRLAFFSYRTLPEIITPYLLAFFCAGFFCLGICGRKLSRSAGGCSSAVSHYSCLCAFMCLRESLWRPWSRFGLCLPSRA